LTGYVPNELVPKYIDLGNLCLMPYKLDTFSGQIRLPLKLFIYSAMGKPILSVSLPEVKRFKPKHVFFYNDKNSFAASAKSVLNDNKLQDSLKSNARNFALNFDYSKLANSCEEIIESEIKAHIPGNAHSQ
jgi:glycosyltransferase involved in cell wall biosynthesis